MELVMPTRMRWIERFVALLSQEFQFLSASLQFNCLIFLSLTVLAKGIGWIFILAAAENVFTGKEAGRSWLAGWLVLWQQLACCCIKNKVLERQRESHGLGMMFERKRK